MNTIANILRKPVLPRYQVIIIFLLLIFPLAILYFQYHPETGFTSIITFGENFQDRIVTGLKNIPRVTHPGGGYDGQFYAQLAFDPLLLDQATINALDNPAYRARRILVPLLVYLLSIGQSKVIVNLYALINFPFLLALLIGIYRIFHPRSVKDFLLLSAIVSSTGVLVSISRALLDLPAAVLLFYACTLPMNGSLGLLSAAILAKETSILSIPIIFNSLKVHSKKLLFSGLIWAILVVLPFVLWNIYLLFRLSGQGYLGQGNFSLPFVGLYIHAKEMIESLGGQDNVTPISELLAMISLTVQAVYLLTHRKIESSNWRMGIGYALLFFCLGGSVFGKLIAYSRAVLPLTVAFNLLLWDQDEKHFLRWFFPGNIGLQMMLAVGLASSIGS